MKVKSLSCVLVTPWTAAYWAPPSMGFSRQEYWSGVPFILKGIVKISLSVSSKYMTDMFRTWPNNFLISTL